MFVANVVLHTLPTWLHKFMLWIVFELRRDWVQRFMIDRFAVRIAAHMMRTTPLHLAGFNTIGNTATPLVLAPLAGVVISAAYSYRGLAHRLPGHNDRSYGVYFYQMPIINLIEAMAPRADELEGLILCVVLNGVIALISWVFSSAPRIGAS